MATVKMKKGDKFADVYDSPETIKQAQLEGYSIVADGKSEGKKDEKTDEPKVDDVEKTTKKTVRQ